MQSGFRSQFQQALCIFPGITLSENGIAGHQDLNPGPHCLTDCLWRYSAVNFDPETLVAAYESGASEAELLRQPDGPMASPQGL